MTPPPDPRENHILRALPEAEYDRIAAHLKLVPMPLGMALYESGIALRHIYFPTNCIVSLLYGLENGASAEIAVVGNEGAIGVSLFMGGESTPSRAIVQSAGQAYRLPGKRLKVTSSSFMDLALGSGIMAKPFQKPRTEIVGTVVGPLS